MRDFKTTAAFSLVEALGRAWDGDRFQEAIVNSHAGRERLPAINCCASSARPASGGKRPTIFLPHASGFWRGGQVTEITCHARGIYRC
ncbi:hypothetical protein [Moorella sp. Hama-1]|uniref:hypothetical protein n=1 Tax=Moorella sp. Hama-1 TaxID=2138101 RepID=UPI001379DFC3|nr:hypothetical protein [Moorella sp. Hama-1]